VDSPAQGGVRTVAGRYELLGRLGTGGMGTVWRAQDAVLGRPVAVKEIVFPHGLPDDEREVLRERTRREARAAARLDHPSAVTVYDVVEEDGAPFLVMELVEARTLADVVRSDGPLSPRHAAEVGLAVLGALEAAHRQGIVHRDVKPGNVLLTQDAGGNPGRVVLTDFGIATSSGDASITSTGLILGSPSYIAPERCRGQSPGPASDLWSLGASLFTAVEGRPPYDGGDPLSTVTAVVTGEHAPFRAAGPLQPVIEGLLERDPAARLDAAAARLLLQAVAGDGSAVATVPAAAPALLPGRGAERTSALPIGDVHRAAEAPAPTGPADRADDRSPDAAAPAAAAAGAPAGPTSRGLPPRPSSRPLRPAPSSRRRSAVLPLALAAVLVVASLLGGLALLTGGWPGDTAAPGPEPAETAAASPQPAPTEDPTEDGTDTGGELERPDGVPADWIEYTHPEQGWTLFHPADYAVTDRGRLKQFRDESTRYTLRVDYTDSPRSNALQAWQEASPGFAAQLADYEELRLENVEFRGYDAAELEFTYRDPGSGALLRVLDRNLVVDGRAYALYWQVSADRFEDSLEEFERLAAAFVPAS
jgi:eukaryotic-like serine/threonine-protein kinase